MHNNSEKISANEINKYCFCPYQWYYERLYGTKYLRNLQNERNKELGLTDKINSNFDRGLKFHNNYRLKRILIFIFKFSILIAIFILAIYLMKEISIWKK